MFNQKRYEELNKFNRTKQEFEEFISLHIRRKLFLRNKSELREVFDNV